MWLLLISVIALLIGACAWSIFGHIDSTVPAKIRVENGAAVCCVAEENIIGITEGMTVMIGKQEAVIESIGANENAEYICMLKTDALLTDAFYDGKVVTKSYKPLTPCARVSN